MFTGIIEELAEVVALKKEGSNVHFSLRSTITNELNIDQSVAHNGVCLTVVDIQDDVYTVTAINETLIKSNLGLLEVGSKVNIERSIRMGARLEGHMVQESDNITVEKGSICVNGVSLTVVNSKDNSFSIAIIPYTFEHTNFLTLGEGTVVNIEFDILGKYIAKIFIKDL